eukprot:73321_1
MGKRKTEGGGNSKRKFSKKRTNHKHNHKHKHQKKGWTKFWIEKTKDNKVPKGKTLVFPVLISRVELFDDHTHRGKSSVIQKETADVSNEDVAVACSASVPGPVPDPSDDSQETTQTEEKQVPEEMSLKSENNISSPEETSKIDASHGSDEKPKSVDNLDNVKNDEGQVTNEDEPPFIQVKRHPSAKGHLKSDFQDNGKELPNGDCGDGIANPFPKEEVPNKYWAQRRRLFSKFDEGVQMDKESWYSVTPEAIALHLAKRVIDMCDYSKNDGKEQRKGVILDCFSGCGGNGIAFANESFKDSIGLTICVDVDRKKLTMAAKNASIYGIDPSRIVFIEGNAVEVLGRYQKGGLSKSNCDASVVSTEKYEGYSIGGYELLPPTIDVVFLSPPWGGMDYLKVGNSGYSLSKCITVDASCNGEGATINGDELLALSANAAKHKSVIYFLPKNVNGVNIGLSAWNHGYRSGLEIEQNLLNGKLKTISVYLSEH